LLKIDSSFPPKAGRRSTTATDRYNKFNINFMEENKTVAVKMTPRDFFMHLLGFATLYAAIISFLTLTFQYINVLFPDKLDFYYTGILNQIRWSSSILFVVFAVFLLINWLLEKDFAKIPTKRDLKFRKWLTYFTLFIAAITIIIDLVTLIYNFYSGELSIRFLLKISVVLIVAIGVFSYYFWDLKRESDKKYKLPKYIAWLCVIIVLGVIVAGFFIVGSPATQRQRRLDDQRINDLQTLQNEIVNYWQQKNKLPTRLDDLQNSISGFVPPKDPETNNIYEYNVNQPLTFELCAVFKTENSVNSQKSTAPQSTPYYYDTPYQQNWSHKTGRSCFPRTIDPDLYRKDVILR